MDNSFKVGVSAGVGEVVVESDGFAGVDEPGLVFGSVDKFVVESVESGWVKLIFCHISSRHPCGIRYQTKGPPAKSVTRKTIPIILQRRKEACASRYRSPIKEPKTWVSSFDSCDARISAEFGSVCNLERFEVVKLLLTRTLSPTKSFSALRF